MTGNEVADRLSKKAVTEAESMDEIHDRIVTAVDIVKTAKAFFVKR